MGDAAASRCAECSAQLAPGQRYCLECGARAGQAPPGLELLRSRRARPARSTAAGAAVAPAVRPPSGGGPFAGLRVPPPKVAAALVLVMLGFGVLIGEAARKSVQDTLVASTRPPLELVLAPHRSTPATAQEAAGGEGEPSGGSAAESEAESTSTGETTTPAPAAEAPAAEAPAAPAQASSPASSSEGSHAPAPPAPAKQLPRFKHVFVVMLSDEPYASVFGPESKAVYLVRTLEPKGALLEHYDAVAHEQLPNELALLTGQGPTAETAADCPTYSQLTATGAGADGQVLGAGCVYPASTGTLLGQLTARHLSWKAYIGGVDEGSDPVAPCAHPTLGQPDPSAAPGAAPGDYATYIDPLAYLGALSESPACTAHEAGISALRRDLSSVRRTPAFSYIAPGLCEDGSPSPCRAGAQAGLAPADSFLKRAVGEILASKAYRRGGLLVITVDEAPSSGEFEDSSSCCGQPAFPNLASAEQRSLSGRPKGGGAVGALLLSPYIKGPETSQEPYNHFSLLASIEKLFGLQRLGYAALPAVKTLEPSLFLRRPAG